MNFYKLKRCTGAISFFSQPTSLSSSRKRGSISYLSFVDPRLRGDDTEFFLNQDIFNNHLHFLCAHPAVDIQGSNNAHWFVHFWI